MSITKYPKEILDEVTDIAINKSIVGADPEWRDKALKCLEEVCFQNQEFTVDSVRELVIASGVTTHENRAMGGIIKTGVAKGWIEATGRTIPSFIGHKIPMQVWKSNIFCLKKSPSNWTFNLLNPMKIE